jgi:hypothetical protein
VNEAGYRTTATWELPGQGMLWAWKPDVERAGPEQPVSPVRAA